MEPRSSFDVLIAGGGPAGLSAALVLGRACRSVLVVDAGRPRNWASSAMWGYLSRDGVAPKAFRDAALSDLARYPDVRVEHGRVVDVSGRDDAFRITLENGDTVTARKVIVATGVIDRLPAIEGLPERFGTSVFQCPYCDGWDFHDRPLGAYGSGPDGAAMARALTAWSDDVILFTDGPATLAPEERSGLVRNRIAIVEERIVRLVGDGGALSAVVLASGRELPRSALFLAVPSDFQSDLVRKLGCPFDDRGGVRGDRYEASGVPGIFVAGNIVKDVQLAIVAAAEGAKAAFGVNRALTAQDFDRGGCGSGGG